MKEGMIAASTVRLPVKLTKGAEPVRRFLTLLTFCLSCSHSFILSTFGFTAVAFVTGSLALWAPTFLFRAAVFTGERAPCVAGNCAASDR